jgi:transposase-like protein
MLERHNEEIKRRTQVVRIIPNDESCLSLIGTLAIDTHENWIEANRFLDMSQLAETKRTLLQLIA